MKTKALIVTNLLLISTFVFATPTGAVTSTPSAQAVESASVSADTIQKSIQDRIKKALQDNLQLAQKTVDQQGPKLRAFIGKVESIAENTISLNTNNSTKQVQVNSDTTIVVDNKTGAALDKVSLNSTAIAMGYTTDNQILHAIRLVVGDISASKYTFQTIFGTVSDTDAKAKTIDVKLPDGTSSTYGLAKKYVFVDSNLKNVDFKNISAGQNIIAILITDTTANVTKIDRMFVWSAATTPTPTATSTPAATSSAKTKK